MEAIARAADTSMGGDRSRFPATSLSRLFAAEGDPAERLRAQFVRVSTTYWKPIYFYIRRVWSKSDADAKDLTQDFILHVLEHDLLERFDRALGNFRTYLKRCLKSFLGTERRDASRLKRGGGRATIAIEMGEPPEVPLAKQAPDEEFDRDWAMETLDRCLREVEESLRAAGKQIYVEVFRAVTVDAPPEGAPSYREVAGRVGLTESDVRNHLRFVRQQLRERLLVAASEYVVGDEDIFAEMSEILGRGR